MDKYKNENEGSGKLKNRRAEEFLMLVWIRVSVNSETREEINI